MEFPLSESLNGIDLAGRLQLGVGLRAFLFLLLLPWVPKGTLSSLNMIEAAMSVLTAIRTPMLVLSVLFLVGCGSDENKQTSVTGQVTVDGVPLDDGAITFSSEGGPAAATEIVGGSYTISAKDGPWIGTNTVRIMGFRMADPKSAPPPAGSDAQPTPKAAAASATASDPVSEQYLPDEFNAKSEIKIDLKAKENEDTDFDLKLSKPK